MFVQIAFCRFLFLHFLYFALRSSDWQVLFVLRVRTAMAQTRSFATIGPSLCNALPSSLRLTLLYGSPFNIPIPSLNLFLLSELSHWGRCGAEASILEGLGVATPQILGRGS